MGQREEAPFQHQIGKDRKWRASSTIESIEPDPEDPNRMIVTTTDGRRSMDKKFADYSKVGDTLSAYSDGKLNTVVNETQHVLRRQEAGPDGEVVTKVEGYSKPPRAHNAQAPHKAAPTAAELGGPDKKFAGASQVSKIEPDPERPDRLNVTFANKETASLPKDFASKALVGDTVSSYTDGWHSTLVNESRGVLMRNLPGNDKHATAEYGHGPRINVEAGKSMHGAENKGAGMSAGGQVVSVHSAGGQTEIDYVTRGEHHFVRVPDGTQPGAQPWNKPLSDALGQLKPGDTFNTAIGRNAAGQESATLDAGGQTTRVHGDRHVEHTAQHNRAGHGR